MKKFLLITIGLLATITAATLALLNRWMQTPNGRLHPYMAVINKIAQWTGEDLTPENLAAKRQQASPLVFGLPLADITDRFIDGPQSRIPLRIYTPFGEAPFPVVVFFHGGGFVQGSIESHDHMAQRLALELEAVVVSVAYRLAPEHPFPAGHDDCYAATCWVAQNCTEINGDVTRLIVAGDSAGGNMAATVSLHARDEGQPAIALQILIYPSTLMFGDTSESHQQFAGYLLRQADMRTYHEWYIADTGQGDNPYASPLLAPDLSHLPPAYIMTAGMDPLRDQGKAYADRLREANVPVVYRNYDGMIHAFMAFGFLESVPVIGRFFSAPTMAYSEMRMMLQEFVCGEL
ncbi:MAG: alpha/beta hydrolase fold domain-containing protein [Aquificales bacterium]|nr:alpha/beta hydrolase fold domain-containing protein [Aquificales bacterium]